MDQPLQSSTDLNMILYNDLKTIRSNRSTNSKRNQKRQSEGHKIEANNRVTARKLINIEASTDLNHDIYIIKLSFIKYIWKKKKRNGSRINHKILKSSVGLSD